MSRISQHFINNIGYLYEEINIQNNDFLNEESQYYDVESAEIVEDIFSTISASMVCEGYSAEGIIGFLADSSEEDIIEKYLNFDESILTESVVSEDYILEQLEIFDDAINEGLGSLIGKAAQGAFRLAGKVASKSARAKVAKKIMSSKNPERLTGSASRVSAGGKKLDPTGAVERLARMKLNKAGMPSDMTKKVLDNSPNIGTKTSLAAFAPTMGKVVKGVQKVKDIAKGAKKALPTVAKGAATLGLGALGGAGYVALRGSKEDSKPTSSTKSAPSSSKDDFLKGSALAKLGGKEGRIKDGEFRTMAWSPESKKRYAAATKGSAKSTPSSTAARSSGGSSTAPASKPSSKPASETKPLTADEKMKQWAKANPKLAARVKPGESGYEAISQVREKPSSYEKQDQTPTQGPKTTPEQEKELSRQAAQAAKEYQDKVKKEKSTTAKESYEPYNIILEYLMGRGHADTVDEAHYIMLEMNESSVASIMEEYNDYLLAEEVSEWVDELLEEGYDLSDYTWDDIVEYYVNEGKKTC
jgi:hypothetical protein